MGWINNSLFLPEPGMDVLVFNGKDVAMLQLWKCNGDNHWVSPSYIFGSDVDIFYEFCFDKTTHWREIEIPKL